MTSLHPDWNVEVGDKWQNDEVQQYHNHKNNIFFDNGLVLQATYQDNIVKSARINTRGNFKMKYGKIDIIAKLPNGKGAWPAVWMMPQDSKYGYWPLSGELDIVEFSGNHPDELVYALHTEKYNHKNKNDYATRIKTEDLRNDFHTFSLVWEEHKIEYYLDNKLVVTYRRGQDDRDTSHKGWPFIEDFYLIMNLAIGGWMGGPVDYNSFPQQFIIKDIKIYQ